MTESNSVRMLQGDASIIGIVVALDGKSSKFVVSDIDPTHGFAHHVYFVDRFTFDMQCQVSVARFSSSCIACNASGKCRWPRPKHRATQYAFTHTCTVLLADRTVLAAQNRSNSGATAELQPARGRAADRSRWRAGLDIACLLWWGARSPSPCVQDGHGPNAGASCNARPRPRDGPCVDTVGKTPHARLLAMMLSLVGVGIPCGHCVLCENVVPLSTLLYVGKGVLNEYARLAMGFAHVRASRYGIRSCSGRVLEY